MCFFRLPGQNSTAAWQTAVLPTDKDDWHSAETASHKDSAHTKPADRCCTTGHWFHGQSPGNQTQWHKTNRRCHSLQTALQRNNRSSAGSVSFSKSYLKLVLPVWFWKGSFPRENQSVSIPEKQPLWKRNSFSGKSAYSPRRSHSELVFIAKKWYNRRHEKRVWSNKLRKWFDRRAMGRNQRILSIRK